MSFERNLGIDPHERERCLAKRRVWIMASRNCLPELSSSGWRTGECGQATKGAWWMPRHQEAMKDAVNCEIPRGAVIKRRSVGIRMGKPGGRNGPSPTTEFIGGRSQPGEVKHLSTRRKRNQPRLR
jgi:hypothetical protein